VTREDVARLNNIVSNITGEFYENSLLNHGAYISDLHTRILRKINFYYNRWPRWFIDVLTHIKVGFNTLGIFKTHFSSIIQ